MLCYVTVFAKQTPTPKAHATTLKPLSPKR